ncbi:deoxyribonuclease IV [Spiroplasma endosymbiont of Virgichneumon dumeticola]|uniref:deoxyribonuclease IV n=1 Tax=Spiroplasma endosymbiont of Virgichneumon dumeticola TaxID=3139323 RepID=UPI0035C91E1C
MKVKELIIGCHVAMKAPKYLLGALQEALSYGANAFMIYTGAPQNTIRKPTKDLFITEFQQALKTNNISIDNVIVHAPYIINLGNSVKPSTFQLAVDFLRTEIIRCQDIGIKTLVLHPGAAVGALPQVALEQIVKGLDAACLPNQTLKIALETMSGKGSEVGINFEQLQYIINNVKQPNLIGVCWDTCHLSDAGYDLNNNLDEVINKFDNLIGLEKLFVMHINDSKNPLDSHKDRHANLGMGYLGFETLINIIYHPKLINKVKILETPWINGQPPYLHEIKMIITKQYNKDILLALEEK